MEKQLKEEEKILESVAEKKALMGVAELAKGIQYDDPIKTRYNLKAMQFYFKIILFQNYVFFLVGKPHDTY